MSRDKPNEMALPESRSSLRWPSRPFLKIAAPVRVVGMVISSRRSHSLGFDMIGHNVVVVCEQFSSNSALRVLLFNLFIEKLLHFRRRPQFPIASRMMCIFNPTDSNAGPPLTSIL